MATEKRREICNTIFGHCTWRKGHWRFAKRGVSKVRFDVIQCVEKGSYVQPCIIWCVLFIEKVMTKGCVLLQLVPTVLHGHISFHLFESLTGLSLRSHMESRDYSKFILFCKRTSLAQCVLLPTQLLSTTITENNDDAQKHHPGIVSAGKRIYFTVIYHLHVSTSVEL